MSDEHDDDQGQDPAVAREAADLLDRLRAELDPPEHRDVRGHQADWRLRRAAELARERAERADDGEPPGLRAGLDPPEHHDIAGQHADWRLRRAAELARERAERDDE